MKPTELFPDVGRPVAYYPGLRRLAGSTTATLLLCQLIYWHGRQAAPEGWIFKRARAVGEDPEGRDNPENQSIEHETGLSYTEQLTARRELRSRGFLKERYARSEHRLYLKLDLMALKEAWQRIDAGQFGDPHVAHAGEAHGTLASRTSLIGTYTDYTQTTTEKKTPASDMPSEESRTTTDPGQIPLTPAAAMQHPDIQLFQEVCGRIPGVSQYRVVIETMQHFRRTHGAATVEFLRPFWLAWSSRRRRSDGKPYDPGSLTWLTEWALNGSIPEQKGHTDGTHQPVNEAEDALGAADLAAARRISRRLRKTRLRALRGTGVSAKGSPDRSP